MICKIIEITGSTVTFLDFKVQQTDFTKKGDEFWVGNDVCAYISSDSNPKNQEDFTIVRVQFVFSVRREMISTVKIHTTAG